jgi:hypothetical protein
MFPENSLLKNPDFQRLSEAKQRIMELLWPMEWVEGAVIFQAVQQTYYDRRVRELREGGWPILTVGTRYKLTSRTKGPGNIRKYPSAKLKKAVLERDKGICQICGSADLHIQFDHKIPQERLGPTTLENLMLLCRTCNVIKRGACKRCTLTTCEGCPFAFPELYGTRVTVSLDKDVGALVKADAQSRGVPETTIILEILSRHYKPAPSKASGL